jgi:type IV pilus assembly protein PilA
VDETQLERWRAAIGANADRYLQRFRRIRDAGGWAPGWNMAAFLHSTGWFWYRRMYGWAGFNVLAPFLVLALLLAIGLAVPRSNLDLLATIVGLSYVIAVFVLIPLIADSIYYRRLGARLADPRAAPRPPSALTLVGALGMGILWLCIVYIGVAPMYADYGPRARVSEAVLAASQMRTEVSEFFAKEQRLPRTEEAGRFRAEPTSKYVQSMAYEPAEKRIVVTLREVQPGKRFALYAAAQDGNLNWTCRTIDLDRKYLPSACHQ